MYRSRDIPLRVQPASITVLIEAQMTASGQKRSFTVTNPSTSFDHFVGLSEQQRRQSEAERFGRLLVDD